MHDQGELKMLHKHLGNKYFIAAKVHSKHRIFARKIIRKACFGKAKRGKTRASRNRRKYCKKFAQWCSLFKCLLWKKKIYKVQYIKNKYSPCQYSKSIDAYKRSLRRTHQARDIFLGENSASRLSFYCNEIILNFHAASRHLIGKRPTKRLAWKYKQVPLRSSSLNKCEIKNGIKLNSKNYLGISSRVVDQYTSKTRIISSLQNLKNRLDQRSTISIRQNRSFKEELSNRSKEKRICKPLDTKEYTTRLCHLKGHRRSGGHENKNLLKSKRNGLINQILIMANIVWWCYGASNCIQVGGQVLRCPKDCLCFDDFKDIQCDNRGLRMFPPDIPVTAQKLSVSNNNIRELPRNIFANLDKLRYLDLKSNALEQIPISGFFGLENLEVLDLSENSINKVPTQALAYLKSLRELILRGNPIQQILAWDFIQVRKTLRHLDVGNLNELGFVSPGAFSGLDSLQVLLMDGCSLTKFPTLQPIPNLQKIDLAKNNFKRLAYDVFQRNPKLESINLSQCHLISLQTGIFDKLSQLTELNLSHNNITNLPEGAFNLNDALTKVELQRNLWTCNCDLIWLANWLQDHPEACEGEECPVCEYPRSLQNMLVKKLTNIDSPPCAALIVADAQPRMNVSEGDGVEIYCPTLTSEDDNLDDGDVVWTTPSGKQINNRVQHGGYEMSVKILENGSLNLTEVSLKDSGFYTCSIQEGDGKMVNATIFLNVTKGLTELRWSTFSTSTITTRVVEDRKQAPTPSQKWRDKDTKQKKRSTLPSKAKSPTTPPSLFNSPPSQVKSVTPKKPGIPSFTTTQPPASLTPINSVENVNKATKIIIGCFVGITLIAAIILLTFYKTRKGNYKKKQKKQNPSENNNGHVGHVYQDKQMNNMNQVVPIMPQIDDELPDEQRPFIEGTETNTGPPTTSITSMDTNRNTGDSNWKETTPISNENIQQEAVDIQKFSVGSQILPPPPEELYQDEDNEKNNSSLEDKPVIYPGPLERGYSIQNQDCQMPPPMPPIANFVLPNNVQNTMPSKQYTKQYYSPNEQTHSAGYLMQNRFTYPSATYGGPPVQYTPTEKRNFEQNPVFYGSVPASFRSGSREKQRDRPVLTRQHARQNSTLRQQTLPHNLSRSSRHHGSSMSLVSSFHRPSHRNTMPIIPVQNSEEQIYQQSQGKNMQNPEMYFSQQKISKRNNSRNKKQQQQRKIPIKVRSMERLLTHQETEI